MSASKSWLSKYLIFVQNLSRSKYLLRVSKPVVGCLRIFNIPFFRRRNQPSQFSTNTFLHLDILIGSRSVFSHSWLSVGLLPSAITANYWLTCPLPFCWTKTQFRPIMKVKSMGYPSYSCLDIQSYNLYHVIEGMIMDENKHSENQAEIIQLDMKSLLTSICPPRIQRYFFLETNRIYRLLIPCTLILNSLTYIFPYLISFCYIIL